MFITALKGWFQQKLSTLHYFSSHYVTQDHCNWSICSQKTSK
eukprot:UN01003